MPLDFYELLHVDADAPQEAIAEAYWHLAEELRTSRHQQSSLLERLDEPPDLR